MIKIQKEILEYFNKADTIHMDFIREYVAPDYVRAHHCLELPVFLPLN